MGNEMTAYFQRLEMLAFFSGFPVVYLLSTTIAGKKEIRVKWKMRLVQSLPVAYGISGLLYLGLLLRNFYPNYSANYLINEIKFPLLTLFGLASVLFLLPFFKKQTTYCLLHSLVFFFILVVDFFNQFTAPDADKHMLKNAFKIYSDSIILNTIILVAVFIFLSFFRILIKPKEK